MRKEEIIKKVKELNLPQNSFVVFGGCPLAIAGIREAEDIDLLVSPEVFSRLRGQGWKELVKGDKDKPLTHDVFEAHENWDFSSYSPTLEQLLSTAQLAEGIPFASLEEVKKWKAASTLPKHLADVALIEQYQKKNNLR